MTTTSSKTDTLWTPEQIERSERIRDALVTWAESREQHRHRGAAPTARPTYRGVYLSGATGAGKTMLADFYAAQARRRRWEVFRTTALEASLEAQASHARGAKARTPHEMVQDVKAADLVLLDDLGRDRTEYSRDVIFALLDTALATHAFVIVTSNRNPADLCEHYDGDDGLKSRLSSLRIIDFPASMTNFRRPAAAVA